LKDRKIFILALIIPLTLWLLAPLVSWYPGLVYAVVTDDCPGPLERVKMDAAKLQEKSELCDKFIARRGQSGDVYGSVGSLFAGMALFAVAYSLVVDISQRRRSRRPVVTCSFQEKVDVELQNQTGAGKSKVAGLSAKLRINVINEPAMNARVDARLHVGASSFDFDPILIGMPLQVDGSQDIDLSGVLGSGVMAQFQINFPVTPRMVLDFKSTYENLEGVKFITSVSYRLTLRFSAQNSKMLWFAGDDPAYADAWADPAAVKFAAALEPGSWKFSED
jgi:hypothetical protein